MITIPMSHLGLRPEPERSLRLLERVRRRGRERRYGEGTIRAYVYWIRDFILHYDRRHPRELGAAKVKAYLAHLANERRVAASTQNQARAALSFLYRDVLREPFQRLAAVPLGARAPTVLSRREIARVLELLGDPARLIVLLIYGSGMPLGECLTIRLKDVDLRRREIVLDRGARRVPLATMTLPHLRRHMRSRGPAAAVDTRSGVRSTGEPPDLHPNASHQWAYVFPAARTVVDATGVRRRHHLHPTAVQRAVARAARDAGIAKRVTCHAFRHSFAAHLLESGAEVALVQELMGHADVRTTKIYMRLSERDEAR